MPVGAAQPLIDVFQNIGQQKEREKQFSIEEARLKGQQAYQQAMEKLRAEHEATYEQGMLNVQQRSLANQEATAAREDRLTREGEARQKAQDVTSRAKRVQDILDKWAKEGAPLPTLLSGVPQEEQDLVKQGVQSWRTAQYNDRLQQSQKDAAQTAEGRINSILPNMSAEMMQGAALGGAPVPTDALQKIAQIHYEEQQNALKAIGAPPSEDDWMLAKSPYWEAQEQKFNLAEEQSKARTDLLTSQAARQKQLVELAPEAAKSLQDYRKAMVDINREKSAFNERFQQFKEKHKEWFDGEKLKIERMNADTARDRARTYKTTAEKAAVMRDNQEARFYAQQDYRSKESEIRATNTHLSTIRQVTNALEQRGFGKVEKRPVQQGGYLFGRIGSHTVDELQMPDGRPLTPDETKQYNTYLAAKEELNPKNPTSLQNHVNELEKEKQQLHTVGFGTNAAGGPVGPRGGVQKAPAAAARAAPGKPGKTGSSNVDDFLKRHRIPGQ